MRSERGFTLVEVLVAFVVTALLLTIVMRGEWQAVGRSKVNYARARAFILGRAMLEARKVGSFAEGTQEGDEQALHWSLREMGVMADPRGLLVLSDMRVTVSDPLGRTLFTAGARRLKAMPRG